MISPWLFHKAIDYLSATIGFIELAEAEKDDAPKRADHLVRARLQALDLVALLKQHRTLEPPERKKRL